MYSRMNENEKKKKRHEYNDNKEESPSQQSVCVRVDRNG